MSDPDGGQAGQDVVRERATRPSWNLVPHPENEFPVAMVALVGVAFLLMLLRWLWENVVWAAEAVFKLIVG